MRAILKSKEKIIAILLFGCLILPSCGAQDSPHDLDSAYSTDSVGTITVRKGKISPTISEKATVEINQDFVLLTEKIGDFNPVVKAGDKVKKGQIIGYNGGVELRSPVSAQVLSTYIKTDKLPLGYPVISLKYEGFSLKIEAQKFLGGVSGSTNAQALKGKFQIDSGVGPTNCYSVVRASGEDPGSAKPVLSNQSLGNYQVTVGIPDNSGDFINPKGQDQSQPNSGNSSPGLDKEKELQFPNISSSNLECLIPLETTVFPGQSGVVVVTADAEEDAVIIPLSAVSGRLKKGKVNVVYKSGKTELRDVELGSSDGANIIIKDGLKEGDMISERSPDLDPRYTS